MKWRNRALGVQVIAGVLVMLFVYTAVSKLMAWEAFQYQMSKQPLPSSITDLLVWTLPTAELITAGCLVVGRLRYIGMVLAFVLMLAFTVYVGLAVSGVLGEVPCSCGGVLQSLGWGEHLVFNGVFLGIAGIGVWSAPSALQAPPQKGRTNELSKKSKLLASGGNPGEERIGEKTRSGELKEHSASGVVIYRSDDT